MRFRTIWDPRLNFSARERLSRTRDSLTMALAAKLPLRLRYWVTMQEIGRATMDSPNVPATPLCKVLSGLQAPKGM